MKNVIALLLSVTMAFSLVACGTSSDSTTESVTTEETTAEETTAEETTAEETTAEETAASTEDGTDHTLTVMCWTEEFNIYAMREAEKIYQEEVDPDFALDIIETPWLDIQTLMVTAATSGDYSILPDIFLLQNNAYQKNITNYPDVFTDLTDLGFAWDEFSPAAQEYSIVDDRHYALPFDNGAAIMSIRTDVIAEAGLTIEDFTDITWDEFIELGVQVYDATGCNMLGVTSSLGDIINIMIKTAGVSLFNDDGTVNIKDNAVLYEAFSIYMEMEEKNVLMVNNSSDETSTNMSLGKTVANINGAWAASSLATYEDFYGTWAMTTVPRLEVEGYETVNYSENGGSSWGISGTSDSVELAADFLNYTFGGNADFFDTILEGCVAISTWIPAGDSEVYAQGVENYGGQEIYTEIVEYSSHILPVPAGVYYYDAQSTISTALSEVMMGVSIEDALLTAHETTEFTIQ
ncbi:MAG: carbohydrate ABC transporter substrate-binding protein [Eubacteriales bacterium]